MNNMTKVNVNAKQIIVRLGRAGHKTYLVGGCVRDMIMGKQPKDWDIVTSATPEQIKEICSDMRPLTVGESFGIVILIFNGEQFDVATMRTDGHYADGRRPDNVQFVSDIHTDLERRDFAMNAIAYDPLSETFIDPFCGGLDIAAREISCVGNARARFDEDRLRILRAFRFAAQFDFDLDDEIIDTINDMMKTSFDDIFKGVSQERITAEFSKILVAPNCVDVIAQMAKIGILQIIIPELQDQIVCEHETPWHLEIWGGFGNTVFAHTLHVMDQLTRATKFQNETAENKLVLMLSALLHDVGKPACKKYKEAK